MNLYYIYQPSTDLDPYIISAEDSYLANHIRKYGYATVESSEYSIREWLKRYGGQGYSVDKQGNRKELK